MIRPAHRGDLDTILAMRQEAARWLAQRGIDQWSAPWPSEEGLKATILAAIDSGDTWMAEESGQVIGTITVDSRTPPPGLWTPAELAEPAQYVHRLIVRRAAAGQGLGARLLTWADEMAAQRGARWLRLDVWTTNKPLRRYYQQLGFRLVRVVHRADYPSGALLQRPISADTPHQMAQTSPSARQAAP